MGGDGIPSLRGGGDNDWRRHRCTLARGAPRSIGKRGLAQEVDSVFEDKLGVNTVDTVLQGVQRVEAAVLQPVLEETHLLQKPSKPKTPNEVVALEKFSMGYKQ